MKQNNKQSLPDLNAIFMPPEKMLTHISQDLWHNGANEEVKTVRKIERNLSTSQIIILGFMTLILLGTFVLMLPISTRDGQGANFSEALFTATSAVCVTGLVVRDTATYWSSFGQGVLLVLIQIGGMGVVTAAVTLVALTGKEVSLKQRTAIQESLSARSISGIVRLAGTIIIATIIIELVGAAVMAPVFCQRYGLKEGIWYGIFHSVSAFCNAGFDLMGREGAFSSLTAFAAQPVINLTIMALIVVGGIGFLTWEDIWTHGVHLRRYSMQSKAILSVTGFLIVIPAVYFFFYEFAACPLGERVWLSLFQAVTPRTAGFNTADLANLSGTGQALTIALMLTGGSPGSTAGGMKTTTLAVLAATAWAVFRRREHTSLFGRRLEDSAVRSAATVLVMYLTLFFLGGAVISSAEGLPLGISLFETASAIGTVGLSLGITPTLGQFSRGILIFLMFFGRVGGLTLVFATISVRKREVLLPAEKLTIG